MEGDLLTNNDEDADPERLDKAERLLKKGQRFYYGEGGRVDPVRLTSAYNMLGGLFMKKRDFYQALQMFDLAAEKARGFDLAVGKPEEAQSKNIHYEAAALVNRSAALLEIEMPQHLERTSALLNAVEEADNTCVEAIAYGSGWQHRARLKVIEAKLWSRQRNSQNVLKAANNALTYASRFNRFLVKEVVAEIMKLADGGLESGKGLRDCLLVTVDELLDNPTKLAPHDTDLLDALRGIKAQLMGGWRLARV